MRYLMHEVTVAGREIKKKTHTHFSKTVQAAKDKGVKWAFLFTRQQSDWKTKFHPGKRSVNYLPQISMGHKIIIRFHGLHK